MPDFRVLAAFGLPPSRSVSSSRRIAASRSLLCFSRAARTAPVSAGSHCLALRCASFSPRLAWSAMPSTANSRTVFPRSSAWSRASSCAVLSLIRSPHRSSYRSLAPSHRAASPRGAAGYGKTDQRACMAEHARSNVDVICTINTTGCKPDSRYRRCKRGLRMQHQTVGKTVTKRRCAAEGLIMAVIFREHIARKGARKS